MTNSTNYGNTNQNLNEIHLTPIRMLMRENINCWSGCGEIGMWTSAAAIEHG